MSKKLAACKQAAGRGQPPDPEEVRALRRELTAYVQGLAAALGPRPEPALVETFERGLALGLELEALILELVRQGQPAYLELPGGQP